jgi:hypothetical protein
MARPAHSDTHQDINCYVPETNKVIITGPHIGSKGAVKIKVKYFIRNIRQEQNHDTDITGFIRKQDYIFR